MTRELMMSAISVSVSIVADELFTNWLCSKPLDSVFVVCCVVFAMTCIIHRKSVVQNECCILTTHFGSQSTGWETQPYG